MVNGKEVNGLRALRVLRGVIVATEDTEIGT